MIIRMYNILYAISVHIEHRSEQSKKECSYPVPSKKQRKNPHFDNINCGLFAHPIGQHVSWSGFVLGGLSVGTTEGTE